MQTDAGECQALLIAGQKMSNLCFNLRQSREYVPDPRHRRTMYESYQEWDAACKAFYAAVRDEQARIEKLEATVKRQRKQLRELRKAVRNV